MKVALVQLGRTLNYSGGVTTFVNNFIQMASELGIKVDLICDEDPRRKPILLDDPEAVDYFYSPNPLPARIDVALRGRFTYNISLETQINFRDAVLETDLDYDAIIINCEDAIPSLYNLHLDIPVYVYSHFTSLVYADDTQKIAAHLNQQTLLYKKIFPVLTQSNLTVRKLQERGFKSSILAPLPIHSSFLENLNRDPNPDATGILFNGRLVSEKKYEKFCELASNLNCKAWVMTAGHNVEKAKELLATYGVPDFEVQSDLYGQERIEFMRNARATYHPSRAESYGYAVYEALHIHDCIIPAEREWTQAFEGYAHIVYESDLVAKTSEILSTPINLKKEELLSYHENKVKKTWLKILSEKKKENQ